MSAGLSRRRSANGSRAGDPALAGDAAEVQRVAGLILANEDGQIVEPHAGETLMLDARDLQL